ncbi:T1SS-143 repeat domain-containing protein [Dongia rigui]|uniref:DUF5801 repeats-in-toxin domain-containing protein n=1 Tax=Dongia rigui TaxID=940149 RepID=A0ABU5DZM1_9PROT|nr:DUF5801 repeats-in-toxin domain-containing protein [Dongia rigui]MDY0872375.1 DUF5801 repeats-in-toxin domain-containing protein [Dongia rigui]
MATDTTNISTDTTASNQLQEGDVEQGHLTQSNAPVPVQVPAGENIVRIQVTPGETLQLPFPTDGLVAKLSPDNANLAVKVGDITVILLGYSEANAAGDVTLLGSDGQAVDVASVLASTDPNLDIATAAGPGAGDQGTGADNNGGLFTPFDPAAGLGGLNAIGGLDPTALNYNLVAREFPELEENDEVDTTPTLVRISQGAVINEDDLSLVREPQFKLAPDQDANYQTQIGNELAKILGPGWSASTGGKQGDGNDPFDTTDNEGEDPGAVDDNGSGVDLDREPLTSTAVINIDFHQDVPGKISFQNGATIPLLDQLQAMGLTSHGHELLFKLLPAVADDPSTPGVDESHGEVLVAYYVTEGEGAEATIVFSIGVREQNGGNTTDFHLDFTIYGPIDNVPGIADANGDIADIFDIDVPFYMVDSDGSVTPVPAGPGGVHFQSVDDVPAFGEMTWVNGGEGNDGGHWVISPTNSSLVHDETAGVQTGGSAIGGDGDIDPTTQTENDAIIDVGGILSHVGWSGATPIGAAETLVTVSFGADGKAEGNKEAGKTVFTGDGAANATAYQLFIGDAANPLEGGKTNWTITVDGQILTVYAEQVDANTIVGYAQDGDLQIPVFVLTLDPNGGYTGSNLTLVQLHQVNQADNTAGDESTPPLVVYGPNGTSEAPIVVRATDFDGDSIDKSLTIEIQDDAPTVGANNLVKLDDDALTGGNSGGVGDDVNAQNVTGTLAHSYGTDSPGTVLLTGATLPDGFTVAVSDGGKTLIISQDGVEVLKVTLSDDTNGSYTVTQLAAIHHPAGQDENNLDFTVNYQVKDSDGDTANGTLAINVDDDTPKITGVKYDTPLLGIVDEDKLPGGIEGGPLDIGNFGASVNGKVLAAPGADQPVTFTFDEATGTGVNVAGAALPPVFALTDLAGNPVTLVVDNGGAPATLKGVAAGVDVFSITLNKATGEFTFTLLQPVKHPSDGSPILHSLEDSLLTLGFNVKVTDADGDSDSAQLYFKINDDTPTVAENAKVQLDDDALADGNAGGTGDDADAVNVTGTLAHNYGADGAGTTLLSGATLPNGQGFSQSLSSDGTTLTISQNNIPVLQIVLTDTTSGNYTVTQLAPIHHPNGSNENNVEFTVKYNVTDGDGDSVGGQIKINVDDDTPILNPNAAAITATVEEDGMSLSQGDKSEGNKDGGDANSDDEAAGLTGSLNGLYLGGADKPLSISMLNNTSGLPALMSGGVAVTYSISNGVLTAKAGANVVFTLSVNSDGSWSFDLQDQLDHVAGNGENNALKLVGGGSVDAIDFSSLIVATDNDGDKAPSLPAGKFAIAIQDDVPVANDDHQFMKESEHTITGNVLTGDGKDGDTATDLPAQADHVGADEPGRITQVHSINVNGPVVNVDNGDNGLDGDTVVVQGQYGKLTINEDGTYSYTLDPAFDINTLTADPVHLGRSGTGATAAEWVAQGFTMSATKFDGSAGTITYDANGIGVSGTKPGLQVPGQIGYDPNTQTTEKITMAFDCPVNSITLKVSNLYKTENDGEQGTWKAYDANGNVIGQGIFGPGADNPATGYIHVNFGSSDNVGTFTIDVGDTQMEGIAKIEFGATEYGPKNNTGNPSTDSSDYYIREVTYVPAVVQEHFDYTLTDKDGDTDNAVLTIDVCDNVPSPRAGNAAGLVTEDTLAGGSNDDPASAPASSVFSGTLPIYNGSVSNLTFDDPASSLDGAPVKTEDAASITLTQAGEWTITINKSTGAFTFTLLDDQAHGDSAKIYGADTLIGKFIATVTGSGGADATGSITITVNDDGPKADVIARSDAGVILETQDKDTVGLLSDTATSTANFGSVFSFLKSGGADGEASSALTFSLNVTAADSGLTSGGAVIHLFKIAGVVVGSTAADAGSVSAGNTIFTVEVNAAGEVKLTQFQQIDHGNSESVPNYDDDVRTLADGKISLTATGTVTDGDGDKASDSATVDLGGNIRFDDDGPTAKLSEGSVSIRLDESVGVDANDPNAANDDAASVGFIGKQTGSIAGLFGTPDYGADGQGAAPEYQLVLKDAGGLGTSIGTTNVATNLSVVDTANAYANDNIVLVSVSAYQVNGYVGAYDPNNAGAAVLAFTVQVDPATGVVTVEQKLPIAHEVDGASIISHDDLASLIVSGQAGGGIFAAQTVTDGDGDKSTVVSPSSIGIGFEDDGPTVVSASSNVAIDEDALPNGLADGPGDDAGGASAAFAVNVDFGTDGKAAAAFALTGVVSATVNNVPVALEAAGGQPIVISVLQQAENGYPAGTLVGWSGPGLSDHSYWIFTVTIDAQTGQGNFNLLKPLDHPIAGTEDNIVIAIDVRATDGDGDFTNATVTVNVDDDTPTAVNDTLGSFVEGSAEVDLGTVREVLLTNDKGGADGIEIYGSGGVTLANGGVGSLGGQFTIVNILGVDHLFYKPAANVADDAQETIQYTVKDRDGDPTTGTITTTVTDRGGGSADVSVALNGPGDYEDNAGNPINQPEADQANIRLVQVYNVAVNPTDLGDTVDSVVISGIPSGANVHFGLQELPVSGGSISLVRGQDGGIYDSFLNDLTQTGGTAISVTLAEHDSRDVTLYLNAVVDSVAVTPDNLTVTVDAVAAQPELLDPSNQSKPETGGATTTFTVNTVASFADIADDNETQYVLIKNPDAGWSLGPVLIDGVPAAPVVGGLAEYPGYTAFAVSTQADAADGSQGSVNVSFEVIGPGNVASDTTKTIEIKAVAIDTEVDSGLDPNNDVADATQLVDLKITDRTGGTDDVSFMGDGPGGFEDGQPSSTGQTSADPLDQQLELTFNLKATANDPADAVNQVVIGGIPSGATATWSNGIYTLTFTGGAPITVDGASGGTENIGGARAAFLADLIDGNGADLVVKLAEHDSRDLVISMQSTIGGTATTGDIALAIVDAVAAEPALIDPDNQSKQEAGGANTTFNINTMATFADIADGNEAQYVLIKNPDAGWSLGTVYIDGVPAIPVVGGLSGYPGYTAFDVSARADIADLSPGAVNVSFAVNGPGDVASDTTKTIEIRAVAVDTEEGIGLNAGNNVAEVTQTVDLKITDRSGGDNFVFFKGYLDPQFEDNQASPADQPAADAADQRLTLNFNLKSFANDASDDVDQVTIGGVPSGATAVWSNGVFTLTFTGGADITVNALSGGVENIPGARAAFLAQLENTLGADLAITLAEHDSRDVTLTLNSVIGGTAATPDSDSAVIDAVAAQPTFTITPTAIFQVETGGAATTFTVNTNVFFADTTDGNEKQYILVKHQNGDWTMDSVTVNGTALTATLSGPQVADFTTYEVTGLADAGSGNVPLTVVLSGPGNVSSMSTDVLNVLAVAQDVVDGADLDPDNNTVYTPIVVPLHITDRSGGAGDINYVGGGEGGYEDANATSAGQTQADPVNTLLQLSFNLKAVANDPGDPINALVVGGLPAGATATWTDGVNTLTFTGPMPIAATPGTPANDAFLADVLSGDGANITVTMPEHSSTDVTLTINTLVIGGTLAVGDSATAIVDAVAAQPSLTDPVNDTKQESGSSSTSFAVQTVVTFADYDDDTENQYVLVKNPDSGWSLSNVTVDGAPAVPAVGSILALYPGYSVFSVTLAADANDGSKGQVTLGFTVSGPGNVADEAIKTIEIKAVAVDAAVDTDLTSGNNLAEATQTVDLKITDTAPTVSAVQSVIRVDEDGFSAGNTGPADDAIGDDTSTDSVVFNGNFNVTAAKDAIVDITLGTTGGLTGLTTLDNIAVKTVWDPATKTLTGFADSDNSGSLDNGERPVFTLVVTNVATGAYTFTLLEPVKHDAANGGLGANVEDDKSFSINIQVKDADGSLSNVGQATINIDDDTPVAVDDATLTITNIGQATAGTNLLANDHAGADQGGTVIGIRLGGESGSYTAVGVGGTDISIKADGTEGTPAIGTLHVNPDGSWTFNQTTGSELPNLTFSYQMKDGDGDIDTASFQVNLDSVPTITVTPNNPTTQAGEALVDEDWITGGSKDADQDPNTVGTQVSPGDNAGGASATGTWATSNGDPTVTVTVDGIVSGTTATGATALDGASILWFTSGSGLPAVLHGKTSAGGADYFTLTINTNGTWQFDLLQPVKHSGADSEDPNVILDSVTLKATDADGDFAKALIKIAIDDDMPVAVADTGTVNEGALLTVNAANGVLKNDSGGADGFDSAGGVIGVRAAGGNTTAPALGNVATEISGLYGKLTLNADGSYSYKSNANAVAVNAVDVFVYTVKDKDGDTATTTLTINVANGTVIAPDDNDALVYENALDKVKDGNDLVAGTVTGSLGEGSALETDDSNQLNATGGFGALTYSLVGSATGTYGTIQINSDGSYTYTLTKNYDSQPDSDNGYNVEENKDSFTYQVTDANGNTATGTITVDIVDDVPVITWRGSTEGDLHGGAPAPSGYLAIDEDWLGNGNQDANASSGDAQGDTWALNTYQVSGADGLANAVISGISVDGASGDALRRSSDGAKVLFVLSADGKTLTGYADANNSGSIEPGEKTVANKVVEATVVVGGTLVDVKLQVFQPLQHDNTPANVNSGDGNVESNINLHVTLQVTDGDGDKNSIVSNFQINDDMPVAVDDGTKVITTLNGDATPELSFTSLTGLLANDAQGADTASISKITFNGTDYTPSSGVITVNVTGGVLTVNSNGAWTFNQTGYVASPTTHSFTYTLKDADGDTSTATFAVKLDAEPTIITTNTTPATAAGEALVDEDWISGGRQDSPASAGDDAGTNKATGTWASTGGDPTVTVTIDGITSGVTTTGATAQDGSAIKWYVDAGNPYLLHGKTSAGGADYFTLEVKAGGTWEFTLLQAVKHSGANSEDPNVILGSVALKAIDADGDSSTAFIKIAIDDDMPVATNDAFGQKDAVTSTAVSLGNVLTNDFSGADGYASPIITAVSAGNGGGTVSAVSGGFDIAIASKGTVHIDSTTGAVTFTASAGNTISNAGENFSFSYTVKDADGDTSQATATYSMKGAVPDAFVLGENVSDTPATQGTPTTTDNHRIDDSPNAPDGSIDGAAGNDLLIGDVGGKTTIVTPGQSYSIALICDMSLSMSSNDQNIDRVALLKSAVTSFINSIADFSGSINIGIIAFGTTATIELTLNGLNNGNKQQVIDEITSLYAGMNDNYTNYEAAFNTTNSWFAAQNAGGYGAYQKLAYFMTDGDPTTRTGGSVNTTVDDADMSEGYAAYADMLADNSGVQVHAIGIGSGVTTTRLQFFDNTNVVGTADYGTGSTSDNINDGNIGQPLVIQTAGELTAALQGGSSSTQVAPVGNDIVNGDGGNDVMLGDSIYYGSADAGWAAFKAANPALSDAQLKALILANVDAFAQEGTVGGNDTMSGGAGNDIIFGQGGNDDITGGTGTDRLVGGTGNDTYRFAAGDGNDTIEEAKGSLDTVVITDANGPAPTVAKVGNDLVITYNGGETITVKNHFLNDVDATNNQKIEFVNYNGVVYTITGGTTPVLTLPTLSVADVAVTEGGTAVVTVSLSAIAATDVTVKLYTSTGTAGSGDFAQTYSGSGAAITVTIPQGSTSATVSIATTQDTTVESNETFTVTLTTPTGATIADGSGTVTINNDDLPAFPTNTFTSIPSDPTMPAAASSTAPTPAADSTPDAGDDWWTGTAVANTIDGQGGNDRLDGLGGIDNLTGGSGDDYIDGGSGADVMVGGSGNDRFIVDDVSDSVSENNGEGTDTVFASVTYTISDGDVENLVLTGSSDINGTGNSSANNLYGNSGANVLTGGGGADNIDGGSGHDTLNGDAGDDNLFGGTGNDTLNGGDNNDTLLGGDNNDILNGGNGNDVLSGGAGADKFDGGAGNDIIKGVDADDLSLSGGLIDGGADTDLVQLSGLATFNSSHASNIKNVEVLDFEGGSGTNITLSYNDVISMTDSDHVIAIRGEATDNFDTTGWTQIATGVAGDGGRTYTAYQQDGVSGVATVYVENVI